MVTVNEVFRDFATDGLPSSGAHKPEKAKIRELLNAFQIGDADGIYDFIPASNVGAGTANAIEATTSVAIPDTPNGALIALPIVAENTASPVTVSFNGGAALTVKNVDGSDPQSGDLTAGMIAAGYVSGSTFRLISDPSSVHNKDAAEAAQTGAEAARDLAAGYASDVVSQGNVPIFATVDGMSGISVPDGIAQIELTGRHAVGDGPRTSWNRVGLAEPDVSPSEKFQTADEDWWRLVANEPTLDMFTDWTPQAKVNYLQSLMSAGEAVSIACYGDSTTDGTNTSGWTANPVDGNGRPVGDSDHEATAPNAWPAKMKKLLRAMHGNDNIDVWNAGYYGKQLQNGWAYANYERAVIDNPAYGAPTCTIVAFGLNDVAAGSGSELTSHIEETRKLCRKVMAYGSIPILMTCDANGWSENRPNTEVYRQIDAAKRSLAADLKIPLIEMSDAIKNWFGRNVDGYRWLAEQADLLHLGDAGHAFKASYAAKEFFADVVVFQRGEQARRLPSFDSASASKYGGLATDTNALQGGTPTWSSTAKPLNANLIDAWIWNEEPEAEIIYRGIDNENFTDAGTADGPRILIDNGVMGSVAERIPANIGFNRGNSPYFRSDLPYRIRKLPYGLNRVIYNSGNIASNGQWLGNLEVWKTLPGSNHKVACGYFRKNFSAGPPAQVELLPENTDGSNVYGLCVGDTVDIFAELILPTSAGFVVSHCSGYGDAGFGTRSFAFLFRTSFLTLYIGVVKDDGTVEFSSGSLAQASFSPSSSDINLRVRITRDGDNQIVKVWDDFAATSSVINATLDRSKYPVHFAGAVGGLFWNAGSAGSAAIRSITVERS